MGLDFFEEAQSNSFGRNDGRCIARGGIGGNRAGTVIESIICAPQCDYPLLICDISPQDGCWKLKRGAERDKSRNEIMGL